MKKLLAILLALTLALGMLPGALAEAEAVKIVYAFNGNGMQTDTALVQEALNEWLKSHEGYEHISIELQPYANKELASAITLAQASGEQIDICNSYGVSLGDYVADGYAIPLDDLLANTDIPAELPEWLLDLGKYNGVTYFVPNYQNPANVRTLQIPVEYAQYYEGGVEALQAVWLNPESTTKDKMATLEEFVLAVREGTGKETKWAQAPIYPGEFYPFDQLNGTNIIVLADSAEAICTWQQDWFKDVLEVMGEWYSKGIVHPDCATYTATDYMNENFLNDESFVYAFGNGMANTAEEATKINIITSNGIEQYQIPIWNEYFTTYSWGAGGNWITATCEHPEEAMMIIDLLNTEKGAEFYNLLVYGIEGKQYTKNEDGTITTLEYDGSQGGASCSYMTPGWMVGNTMNQYQNQGFISSYGDRYVELCSSIGTSETTKHSLVAGILFDTTSVADEIAQINAVVTEYDTTLRCGIAGEEWETYYNEFLEKLEAAGVQAVLDCYNEQIQANLE